MFRGLGFRGLHGECLIHWWMLDVVSCSHSAMYVCAVPCSHPGVAQRRQEGERHCTGHCTLAQPPCAEPPWESAQRPWKPAQRAEPPWQPAQCAEPPWQPAQRAITPPRLTLLGWPGGCLPEVQVPCMHDDSSLLKCHACMMTHHWLTAVLYWGGHV